ncbi:MAG: AMP-binding protein [Eubacteriales bacterium]|nr:AMP-binding protein [Eubacteriales bacterium]
MNYIALFTAEAQKNAEKSAVVDRGAARTTSYAELDRLSSLAAGKIYAMGYREGDFVVICMENSMEYIAAYLGTLKAGCAVVPLSTAYPQERVDYIVKDCGAKLVIQQDFFEDIDLYGEYCAPPKMIPRHWLYIPPALPETPRGYATRLEALLLPPYEILTTF